MQIIQVLYYEYIDCMHNAPSDGLSHVVVVVSGSGSCELSPSIEPTTMLLFFTPLLAGLSCGTLSPYLR